MAWKIFGKDKDMKEDFKKWLCELAEEPYDCVAGFLGHKDHDMENIFILIKAMWAINREGKWLILISASDIDITRSEKYKSKLFSYKNHNNSEQQALEKALEYIYEQDKG